MEAIVKQTIRIILKNEGGYANYSADPGGETNYGISDRADGVIDACYRGVRIETMTKKEAIDIYFNDYYKPMRLHFLHSDLLRLHVFDMGVNAGPKTAIKMLQKLAKVKADGVIGPVTAAAAKESVTVDGYKDARVNYYESLVKKNSALKKFIKGWINRVNHTKFN